MRGKGEVTKGQESRNKRQDKRQGTRNKYANLYLDSCFLVAFYLPTRWDKMIPVATAAFKDSAAPDFGMVIF